VNRVRAAAVGWWRRRTLHDRLSLLVSAAVAAALTILACGAWLVVAEIQDHQIQSALTADANTIAAQPDQWLAAAGTLPGPNGPVPGRPHGPHQLGPRWQILDPNATVVSDTASPLPVSSPARQVAAGAHEPYLEEITVGHDGYRMLTVPIRGGGAVQVAIDHDQGRRTLTIFGLLLALGCLAGIAGAAWLGRVVARAGLLPVQRLTEEVEHVAVTMDLNRPVTIEGADEIARLGRSVNTMLTAIDTSRRAQRTLVEDAGHELRTPLTSIRTNIELLLEVERHPERAHLLPPEDRGKLLHDLDAQAAELATLTTELVELSREETTREVAEPVELTDVIHAAVNRVRIRAPGLTFSTELTPVTVTGRPGELERMVLNVLDNAAKWSPPGATVRTRLTGGGPHWCTLTVTDTGPGIDEADRPHVFDRFYRATAARSLPGSGLGLAIVAQTAAQHGGTVTAQASAPHGTIITIRLPVD
jgi:two-component system sensor histidine kinase MprB